MLETKK
jgi:hypothetical protein